MALRRCAHCNDKSAWALRVLVAVNVVAGMCLFIFGATAEKPINSAPTVCMILLGVWSWLVALSGFAAAARMLCCLDIFLVLDAVGTILYLVLVGELFMNHDGLLAAIDPNATGKYSRGQVNAVLRAAQWLMLLFLVVQIAALVVALLMRFFIKEESGREAHSNWDDAVQSERALTMSALRTDVEGGHNAAASTSSGKYGRLMAKMQKYNEAAHIKFAKKGWFGW